MDSPNQFIAATIQPYCPSFTHLSILDSNSQTISLPANSPSATILTTTKGTSDSTSNLAFTAWKKQDKILLLWLKTTISHSILPYIMHISTTPQVMQLQHQLQTTTKGFSTTMDYVDKKRTISHSLALVARPITDEELMSAILFGINFSYGPFHSAINPHLDSLTTDSLLGLLLQEEEKLPEETKSLQLQANVMSHQYSNRSPINGYPNRQTFTTLKKSSGRSTNNNPLVLLVDHLLALFFKYVRNSTTMLVIATTTTTWIHTHLINPLTIHNPIW
ncbi:hypothetical protein R3W88_033337 [Solanum pinnatisectum]|uniref:Uncharacterized protein n=1 Tax=Solanum pinnatisectum TaxID=50273 RepID=A0AAV9K1G2_9SOLN|nr:hypothetical protein R3W88_033337 [Solanum pinnatisectum]